MSDYGNMVSLIPEFFFDLIARIIPGAYALLLVYEVCKPDIATNNILLITSIVFSSYLIGFTIDRITDGIIRLPYGKIEKDVLSQFNPIAKNSSAYQNTIFKKSLAELVMMRSFAVTTISFGVFKCLHPGSTLPGVVWFVVGSLVFLAAWGFTKKDLVDRFNEK